MGESKSEIQAELHVTSAEFTAPAYRIDGPVADRQQTLARIMQKHGLEYPVMLKPDVGQRGTGVKLIRTPEHAAAYLDPTAAPLIVQRYVADPHEPGIFYCRMPDHPPRADPDHYRKDLPGRGRRRTTHARGIGVA